MQYNRTSFFGIVFALMSVVNTVMEFGMGKGIKGLSPLCLGAALLLFALSLICLRGNLSSLRFYSRMGIAEEDRPAHARLAGLGLMVIGVVLMLSDWLKTAAGGKLFWLAPLGVLIGVGIIARAQMKYGKRRS